MSFVMKKVLLPCLLIGSFLYCNTVLASTPLNAHLLDDEGLETPETPREPATPPKWFFRGERYDHLFDEEGCPLPGISSSITNVLKKVKPELVRNDNLPLLHAEAITYRNTVNVKKKDRTKSRQNLKHELEEKWNAKGREKMGRVFAARLVELSSRVQSPEDLQLRPEIYRALLTIQETECEAKNGSAKYDAVNRLFDLITPTFELKPGVDKRIFEKNVDEKDIKLNFEETLEFVRAFIVLNNASHRYCRCPQRFLTMFESMEKFLGIKWYSPKYSNAYKRQQVMARLYYSRSKERHLSFEQRAKAIEVYNLLKNCSWYIVPEPSHGLGG
jgi:hypothetical protein